MRQDFALDRTIRFAGVIDKMSKISLQEACARGGRSHLIQRRTDASCTLRLPLERRCSRTLIPVRAGLIYTLSEREKIKKITSFPIGEIFVLVSNDKKGTHGRIIGKILNLIAAD